MTSLINTIGEFGIIIIFIFGFGVYLVFLDGFFNRSNLNPKNLRIVKHEYDSIESGKVELYTLEKRILFIWIRDSYYCDFPKERVEYIYNEIVNHYKQCKLKKETLNQTIYYGE